MDRTDWKSGMPRFIAGKLTLPAVLDQNLGTVRRMFDRGLNAMRDALAALGRTGPHVVSDVDHVKLRAELRRASDFHDKTFAR